MNSLDAIRGKISSARGRHIKRKYERLRVLNEKYNFQIPNFISIATGNSKSVNISSSGRKLSVETMDGQQLPDLSFYIGRIEKGFESRPYTRGFIYESLNFLILNTSPGDKIRFYLGNFVGESLNFSDDSRYFTIEEQKKELYKLFSTIDKKRIKDFEIIDLEKENRGLSELLRTGNKESVPVVMPTIDFSKKISSRQIYESLLYLGSQDKEFMMLLESPKPANEKAHRLYSLCEISIRLADLLNGRTFQGGSKLQTKYDNLISYLIDPRIPNISYKSASDDKKRVFGSGTQTLEEFRKACAEKADKSFSRLYFDTDECERFYKIKEGQDNETKATLKKFRNIIMGLAMVGLGAGSATAYFGYKKHKELSDSIKASVLTSMKGKSIEGVVEGPGLTTIKEDDDKVRELTIIKKNILRNFEIRYGITDERSKDLLGGLILSVLPDSDLIKHYDFTSFKTQNMMITRFADDLVNKYPAFFATNRINCIPYAQYREMEESFKFMINNEDCRFEEALEGMIGKQNIIDNYDKVFQDKGDYMLENGEIMKIAKMRPDQRLRSPLESWGIRFNLRRGAIEHFFVENSFFKEKNGSKPGIDISYDYFWQTRSEIRLIYDVFCNVYLNRFMDNDSIVFRPEDEKFIKKILIWEFINNEKKIKAFISEKGAYRYATEDFRKKYSRILKDRGIRMNHYGDLMPHLDAFRNTAAYGGADEYFNAFESRYLGSYVSDNGEKYAISKVTIKGKEYIACWKLSDNEGPAVLNNKAKSIASEFLDHLR